MRLKDAPTRAGSAEQKRCQPEKLCESQDRQVKLFCMRSRYSGQAFVRAYPYERQEIFLASHIHISPRLGVVDRVAIERNDVLHPPQGRSTVQTQRLRLRSGISGRHYGDERGR